MRHNPYFNRWFSAIEKKVGLMANVVCHNPYFNRWFSAIRFKNRFQIVKFVTILILIDGFLQYKVIKMNKNEKVVTILILIDGFLQ